MTEKIKNKTNLRIVARAAGAAAGDFADSELSPQRPCQLCGRPQLQRWEVHPGSVLWKCEPCELFQYGPKPRPTSYRKSYHAGYRRDRKKKVASALVRLSYIRDLVRPTSGKLRSLDVGCSIGASVEAAKQLGWHSTGVDVSNEAIDYCNSVGLKCYAVHSDHLPFQPQTFDVVTAWHVIEHVVDVRQTLQDWGRVLKKDGVIVLATPDASSPKVRRLGKAYPKFWAPEHVYTFTPANLAQFAIQAGYQVEVMPRKPNLKGLAWGVGLSETLRRWNENLLHWSGAWKEFYLVLRKPEAQLHADSKQLRRAA